MAQSILPPRNNLRNQQSQTILAETRRIMACRRQSGQAILANLRAYKAARQRRTAA